MSSLKHIFEKIHNKVKIICYLTLSLKCLSCIFRSPPWSCYRKDLVHSMFCRRQRCAGDHVE